MRQPYIGVRQFDADKIDALPGCGVLIVATVAGNVKLQFQDGSKVVYPVAVGATQWNDVAIVGYLSAGTTATATVYKLI